MNSYGFLLSICRGARNELNNYNLRNTLGNTVRISREKIVARYNSL